MEREPGLWLADTKRLAVPGTEPFAKLPRPVAAMMYIVKNHIGNSTKTYNAISQFIGEEHTRISFIYVMAYMRSETTGQ